MYFIMKVIEFVNKYQKLESDKSKENCLNKNVKVKDYIPYIEKMTLAQNLVNVAHFDSETKRYSPNSAAYYLLYNRCIIEAYTNLEVDANDWANEYDALDKSGVLYKILLEKIPERELAEFKLVCNMAVDDAREQAMEPHRYLADQIERASTILGTSLNPVLEKLADAIGDIDDRQIEKLGKMLNKGFKIVK